jgi:hypothetical protein
MKRRTAAVTIAALLSLSAAGYAAAGGRFEPSHGRPSTTPPPWSNGAGHGKAGEPHGQGSEHANGGVGQH